MYSVLTTSLWPSGASAGLSVGQMPTRVLGRTGRNISILGLGGHHLGQIQDEHEAIRLARTAIDMGVTFMDNAWEYHQGRSEVLLGKALKDGYRERVFLMTKHHGRDKKTAIQHLEDSLRRLQTDIIDLWQFHEIIYDADPDMIFAPDGGIEAAEEAKKQGKVRYIGFTGHKDPAIFRKMLSYDYPWDSVQMPVNALDAHFKSFQRNILPILLERNIGPIAMKSLGGGHILESGVVGPRQALRYAWSQPVATVVCGMTSVEQLEQNVEAAMDFKPLSRQEEAELLEKARPVARDGAFEPFKTTSQFDGIVGKQLHGLA
jgi:predicted aldo/keto reductase-like oxidoreductase